MIYQDIAPAELDRLRTVRDLLRYAVSRLNEAQVVFGHGTQDAFDEAAYMVLHTLHLPMDRLDPFLDAGVLDSERNVLLKLLDDRIRRRIPAPYLTHQAWLQGRSFYVDERVIIPRSFIAELLNDGLGPWVEDPYRVEHVLDMCTGSGCLAILGALTFPYAKVDAVDLSPEALQVARRNVDDYGLQERISLHESNLFESLPGNRYNLILCNPPYVNARSMASLPPEFLHEPQMALAGGQDGMDLIRVLLTQAASFLEPDGILVLEIGHERGFFEIAFPELDPVWLSTSAGDDQVLMLRREQLA